MAQKQGRLHESFNVDFNCVFKFPVRKKLSVIHPPVIHCSSLRGLGGCCCERWLITRDRDTVLIVSIKTGA